MTHSTYETEDFALPLPITQSARQLSQEFARQQPTPAKAAQVQLNTLAVCVVNDYLQLMGIPTHLAASDSWNPIVRLCADVADLELPGIGRLECRPVAPNLPTCAIPPETWEERVGYVVVQIDASLQNAQILGFAPSAAVEQLPLNQLQSPEALMDYLGQLQPVKLAEAIGVMQTTARQTLVNLGQWAQGLFEEGWQTVESLLSPPEFSPAFVFRGVESPEAPVPETTDMIRRAKLIDLGIQAGNQPVALVVELRPEGHQETAVRLQVHPTGSQLHLPSELELAVLDDTGNVFLATQARSADNYIQLQFSGMTGERFSSQVAIGDTRITQEFVI
ncbi:DUF1822 family protein [Pantanalinema sp. GBBB05]|uniref:DUF1822 family protein n=1 Tax=Pantanalinema sp. GBBB05 TaxID=2604139 RepID=UPI001D8769B8|nr:DUF1822 family protein [Pantanalinema sp. GBBB05]